MKRKGDDDDAAAVPPGTLVPQEHGGALKRGNPGNRGGTGRPPSEIRERLRGSFEDRIEILDSIADGVPVQQIRLNLRDIASHLTCPSCQHELEIKKESADVTIEATVTATPRDRIRAIDMMAKYGLGAVREITWDGVRDRLKAQIIALRQAFGTEEAERIIAVLRPIWK